MRIVFLNRFFAPDISATSQILSDLTFHLAGRGHEVHVICSQQLYENASACLPASAQINGVYIHRVWTSSFGRRALVGRAIDYASFYIFAAIKLFMLADRHSIIVAKTDPPLISVPASAIARWRGARYVNWIQDLFPEVATALGVTGLKSPLGKLITYFRDKSLLAADATVVLGTRMADLICSRGVDSTRVKIIPNWSDIAIGSAIPEEVRSIRAEWGQQNHFVAMYSGNMGRAHDFETILNAATVLRDCPNISFVLVGGGARKDWLVQETQARSLASFSFHRYQPREQLANSLSVADVHLISLQPEMEGLIVPSKFYGILAVGRPTIFIGDPDGELARLIRQHDVGTVVSPGDTPALAQALITYADNPSLVARQGKTAFLVAKNYFDRPIALAAWEALLLDVSLSST